MVLPFSKVSIQWLVRVNRVEYWPFSKSQKQIKIGKREQKYNIFDNTTNRNGWIVFFLISIIFVINILIIILFTLEECIGPCNMNVIIIFWAAQSLVPKFLDFLTFIIHLWVAVAQGSLFQLDSSHSFYICLKYDIFRLSLNYDILKYVSKFWQILMHIFFFNLNFNYNVRRQILTYL